MDTEGTAPQGDTLPQPGTLEPENAIPTESGNVEETFQKRYTDIRPQFDKATQALKERDAQLAEAQAEVEQYEQYLEALQQSNSDEEVNPRDQQIEFLMQQEAARQEQQQSFEEYETDVTHIDQQLQALEESNGGDFTESEAERIFQIAPLLRDENGKPNVSAALELLNGHHQERVERQAKAKEAPRPPLGGGAGSEQPDFSKQQAREAAIIKAMREGAQNKT